MAARRSPTETTPSARPTPRQAEYLDFIRAFTKRWGVPPSFEEIGQHFMTTPPSVNSMIKLLDARGFLTRIPGQARTLRVIIPEEAQPPAKPSTRAHAGNDEVESLVRLAALVVERLVPAVGTEDARQLSRALDVAATMAGASDQERRDAKKSLLQVAMSAQGLRPDVGKPQRAWAPRRAR
jgi:hypothetical protein